MVSDRDPVPSSLALEFSDDTGADTDNCGICARDCSRIQESAMLRALQRSAYNFWPADLEQFDLGQ
jgi:hypothetical protein